jgi:transposase
MMDLDLGLSNTELAKRFGVSEGTIRHHKRKQLLKKADGRKFRYSAVSEFTTPIETWVQENISSERKRKTMWSLYIILNEFHNYHLSYDALRRYVRKHYPDVLDKTYGIRIETPPGKLSQLDWKEKVQVQLERPGNWITVHFLILLLCFSRKPAVVVREEMNQQSFLSAHYAALKKLGGVTEFIRPDCMKTAVKAWNGRSSEMNADYADFLCKLGAKGFPARPGTATDKGKVEKKIQDIFRSMDFRRMVFRNLEDLQQYMDRKVEEKCLRTICPATGTSISQAYEYEKRYLSPLSKQVPEIPVETITTPVQKDSLVWFKGNYYQLPQGFTGKTVRCINTGTQIRIYFQGELLETYAYEPNVKGMIRVSRKAITESTRPMSELVKEWTLEVAARQLDYYQEITGGVR